MTAPDRDPFGNSASSPSISFANIPDNTVFRIVVTDFPRVVQSRDMAGDPLYWVPGQRGKKSTTPSDQPCQSAVINGTAKGRVNTSQGPVDDGTEVALWAGLPSDLKAKIGDAQTAVKPGYRLKPGDELAVAVVAHEPTKKGNPKSIHKVVITPGVAAPAGGDPFGDSAPPAEPWGSSAPAQQAAFGDEPPF